MSVRYSLTRSSSSRSTRSLANDAPSSLESSEIRRAAHTPAGARPGLSSDPRYRLGQEAPPRDVVRCCVETRTRRGGGMGSSDGEVDLTMELMRFDASDPARLKSVLARYVVLSRGHPGCSHIDLALSAPTATPFVVVQKWETPEAQRRPFDSEIGRAHV